MKTKEFKLQGKDRNKWALIMAIKTSSVYIQEILQDENLVYPDHIRNRLTEAQKIILNILKNYDLIFNKEDQKIFLNKVLREIHTTKQSEIIDVEAGVILEEEMTKYNVLGICTKYMEKAEKYMKVKIDGVKKITELISSFIDFLDEEVK